VPLPTPSTAVAWHSGIIASVFPLHFEQMCIYTSHEEKTTLIAYEAMADFSILSAKLTKNLLI
jgi:hypothetical protein